MSESTLPPRSGQPPGAEVEPGPPEFGLWPDGDETSSWAEARERMASTLVALLPPSPARLLHVGGGGGEAARLAALGYEVTHIASAGLTSARTAPVAGSWDVLWLHEAGRGLGAPRELASRASELLHDGGVLLFADEVLHDRAGGEETGALVAADLVAELYEHGFCVLRRDAVGERVLRSCDWALGAGGSDGSAAAGEARAQRATWERRRDLLASGRLGYEIVVARNEGRPVRSYRPGDEAAILAMFKEQFHVERSTAHFEWKYLRSPYGGPRITVIFAPDGALLAHYAGYALPCLDTTGVGPASFLAVHAGDTMTRPEGRRTGLGATSLVARSAFHFYARHLETKVPFAYGVNTGKIRALGARYMGYRYVEAVRLRTLQSPERAVRRWPPWRWFPRYAVEPVHEVGAEWDRLVERVAPAYGLLTRRDAEYIRWRYLGRPDVTYLVLAVRRAGRLVGWGVFLRDGESLRWGDALFDPREERAVPWLLGAALEAAGPPTPATIQTWTSPHPRWWNEWLDRLGFDSREEPQQLTFCYVTYTHPRLESVLRERWYHVWGDCDLF